MLAFTLSVMFSALFSVVLRVRGAIGYRRLFEGVNYETDVQFDSIEGLIINASYGPREQMHPSLPRSGKETPLTDGRSNFDCRQSSSSSSSPPTPERDWHRRRTVLIAIK